MYQRQKKPYRFVYPDYGVDPAEYGDKGDPMIEHRKHNGQTVEVVRRLRRGEFDFQGEAMFIVRAADGVEFHVWNGELHGAEYPWPAKRDQCGNRVCAVYRAT